MGSAEYRVTPGVPCPLGASLKPGGVNFSLFSRHAESVKLHLFRHIEDEVPSESVEFSPGEHRTGDIWHAFVENAGPGSLYLYTVEGPFDPAAGHRFDGSKFLLDPYTKAFGKNSRGDRKCVVPDERFDWRGDRPPRIPLQETIIYETHVRGFTVHPGSAVGQPGTYSGLIEKIPYLERLGITAVELLPVHEYDDAVIIPKKPVNNGPLKNYWGYNTIGFFAPHEAYASPSVPGGQVKEFKEMVRSLHAAGLEVILDVVFNHTAEAGEDGPTLSFRGLDNSVYYLLDPKTGAYIDYTGCRNTLNCGHPVVGNMIIESLRYWVTEMHVDGFRFDLAPVLCRDTSGTLLEKPPLIERISEDPVLRDVKLIAEAWDAGGAYLVGKFPNSRWAEWNDRYRDDLRRFWLKDPNLTGAFATRVSGSSDLYHASGRKSCHSINFITAHDGFTLNDIVQYGRKHNEENGEGNKDGNNGEISDNLGVEGPSINRALEKRRRRLIRSFAASLLLSRGTPMILGGDEFRRSQEGNNNAYCQDNETSWFDWYYMKENTGVFDFFKGLIAFRKRHPAFRSEDFYNPPSPWTIRWLDEDASDVNWIDQNGFLAFMITGTGEGEPAYYVMANPSKQNYPCSIYKPPAGTLWFRAIDTAAVPPGDVSPEGEEVPVSPYDSYISRSGSVVVLITKPAG